MENIPIYEITFELFLYFRLYDEKMWWTLAFSNWTTEKSLTTVSYTKSTQKERFGKSLELTLESLFESFAFAISKYFSKLDGPMM